MLTSEEPVRTESMRLLLNRGTDGVGDEIRRQLTADSATGSSNWRYSTGLSSRFNSSYFGIAISSRQSRGLDTDFITSSHVPNAPL
jgi:hypothetical protein